MNIKWYGHACFRIRFSNGISLLTDPYSPGTTGYSTDFELTDIISISHDHKDHNFIPPEFGGIVFNTPGYHEAGDIRINGIEVFHDAQKGAQRGNNIIFIFTDGIETAAHLGDLGHIPSDDVIGQLKNVNVLFIPVGGTYTIGPDKAAVIIDKINPSIIIPMHYKTERLDFPILPVADFLNKINNKYITINGSETETAGIEGVTVFSRAV